MPTTPSGIYYSTRGEGQSLLFVHGSGADHLIWGYQIQGLSDQFNVVALDLNGHHKSTHRDGDGLTAYSQDVVDVIDAISEPVMLLGHSLGGAIALNVALEHPEKIVALGLIGTGAKLKVLPELLELIESDFEAAAMRILELEFHKKPSEEIWTNSLKQILDNGQRSFSRDFNTCNEFDEIERLGEISVPTLVLCGEEDKLTPIKYAEFLRDRIGESQLEIIEDAGHNVMIEQPDAVNEAIRKFVNSL